MANSNLDGRVVVEVGEANARKMLDVYIARIKASDDRVSTATAERYALAEKARTDGVLAAEKILKG